MSSRKETKSQNSGWCLGLLTTPGAAESKSHLWLVAFQQRSVWVRGAKLGLSVGILQAIINQWDVWLAESETLGTVVKTIISPLITFSVALISAAATYVEKLKLQS
jgi:hypothetical protein